MGLRALFLLFGFFLFRDQIFRNRDRDPQRFGKSFETEVSISAQDSTIQTLVLFQNLFIDLDLDVHGSSARFPKSSSQDLTGTKSPSTYLCLYLTSLWSVKWPKPINT